MSELIRAEEWHDRWQAVWQRLQSLEAEAEGLLTASPPVRPGRPPEPGWLSVLFVDQRLLVTPRFVPLVAPGEFTVDWSNPAHQFLAVCHTSAPLTEVTGTLFLDLQSVQPLTEIRLGELLPGVWGTVVSEDSEGNPTEWGTDLTGGPLILKHASLPVRRLAITLTSSLFTVGPTDKRRHFRLGFAGVDAGRRQPYARQLELVRLRPDRPLVGVRVEIEGDGLEFARFVLQIDPGDSEYSQELEVVAGQTVDLTKLPLRWRYERVPIIGGQVFLSRPVDSMPRWDGQGVVRAQSLGGIVRVGGSTWTLPIGELLPRLTLHSGLVVPLPEQTVDRGLLEIRYPAMPAEIVLRAELTGEQPTVIRSARLITL